MADFVTTATVTGISDELRAGLDAYLGAAYRGQCPGVDPDALMRCQQIAALGGYGTRVSARCGSAGERIEGELIELGFGGCQPGLCTDDGTRYRVDLAAVVAADDDHHHDHTTPTTADTIPLGFADPRVR